MKYLFLHGWSASGEIFEKQKVIQDAVFPNLYLLEEPLTFNNIAYNLEKLFKGEELTVIGWSMGGNIALELLKRNELNIKKLVLVSTAPKFIADKTYYYYGVSKALARNLRMKLSLDSEDAYNYFLELMKPLNDNSSKVPYYPPSNKNNAFITLQELYNSNYLELLPKIKIPVTIIHDIEDRVCSYENALYLRQKIKHAQLIKFENTGHLPFFFRSESFNKLVL